jgi:hypothetical protein
VGGGPQIPGERQDARRRRGRGRQGEGEEPGEAMDAEHLGGERGLTRGVDPGVAIAPDQAEEGIGLAHPGPGQVPGQQGAGELADGGAVALGPAGQALDVAQGVDRLVDGEIGAIEGTLARRDARVDLDADRAGVEADGGGVGAGPQGVADVLVGSEYSPRATWAC